MLHQIGRDGEAVHIDALVQRQFANFEGVLGFNRSRTREHRLANDVQALGQAGRACDHQRLRAAADELRVEQEEGQSAEMIAVQMADQDRRDRIGIDAPFADRDHGRRAAIDQHVAAVRTLEMEAGVEAAARTEGIAGPEEL